MESCIALFDKNLFDGSSLKNLRLVSKTVQSSIERSITTVKEEHGHIYQIPKNIDNLRECFLYNFYNVPFLAGKHIKTLEIDMMILDKFDKQKLLANLLSVKSLSHLKLSQCDQQAIDIVSNITYLKSLDMFHVISNVDISPISKLTSLEALDINYKNCNFKDRFAPIQHLTNLKKLTIEGYIEDIDFISSLTKLDYLDLDCFSGNLPTTLPNITHLALKCIESYNAIRNFKNLTHLAIQYHSYEALFHIADISQMPNFSLNFVKELKNLQSLYLTEWNFEEEDRSILETLTELTHLEIRESNFANQLIPCIQKLTKLQHLNLSMSCIEIDANYFSTLQSLKSIDISNICSVSNIHVLESLRDLEIVILQGCLFDTKPTFMQNLEKLNTVSTNGVRIDNRNVEYLSIYLMEEKNEDIRGCPNVKDLYLSYCNAITSIRLNDNFKYLHTLTIFGNMISEIKSIAKIKSLTRLHFEECISLVDISPVSDLVELKELVLQNCSSVLNIKAIEKLSKLRHFAINSLILKNIESIMNHTNIDTLDLSRCYNIKYIDILKTCLSLSKLSLLRMSRYDNDDLGVENLCQQWRQRNKKNRYLEIHLEETGKFRRIYGILPLEN